MRLRLLSRGSDLARLQARMVEQALMTRRPDLLIERLTRSSLGDRDRRVDLWQSTDKGLFTTDLSEALVSGAADIVVHSWKDLPVAGFAGTVVAGTLERADPRDVLLVRREALANRPTTLEVLTSSPRRTWQMQQSLTALLPWSVEVIAPKPVRGNIPKTAANSGSSIDGAIGNRLAPSPCDDLQWTYSTWLASARAASSGA